LKIAVASGKGGTGKTTVATNLALTIAKRRLDVTYLDCDVEEPNGHIFLKPEFSDRYDVTIPTPEVDPDKCTLCGKCAEICQYHAIAPVGNRVLLFSDLCNGCGGCALVCPEEAIREWDRKIGFVEEGRANGIRFIHGLLKIGQAKAPPVIKEVKRRIIEGHITIIDSPAGTSCPVIESCRDADYVILVTEPTPFGLNDLILAVDVVKELALPFGVVVNRENIGDNEVYKFCEGRGVDVIGKIPDDLRVAKAYSEGEIAISAFPELSGIFEEIYDSIQERLLK